jgi:hypothetical protein
MTKLKIEKNVPLPEQNRYEWPFEKMEVGDSFFMEGVKRTTIHATAYKAGVKLGRKFSVKIEEGGFRVWRRA